MFISVWLNQQKVKWQAGTRKETSTYRDQIWASLEPCSCVCVWLWIAALFRAQMHRCIVKPLHSDRKMKCILVPSKIGHFNTTWLSNIHRDMLQPTLLKLTQPSVWCAAVEHVIFVYTCHYCDIRIIITRAQSWMRSIHYINKIIMIM